MQLEMKRGTLDMIIFRVIMIPNFIWFAVPAPNDILRGESITKTVDVIASICQVLMVMSLCIFINQDRKKISITRFIMATIICCLLYFLCWRKRKAINEKIC